MITVKIEGTVDDRTTITKIATYEPKTGECRLVEGSKTRDVYKYKFSEKQFNYMLQRWEQECKNNGYTMNVEETRKNKSSIMRSLRMEE